MAAWLNVPLLARVALVDDPETIRFLNAAPGVDRAFTGRGPLINRWLQRRVSRDLRTRRGALPAFLPRDDAGRREAQAALAARLDEIEVDAIAAESEVSALGAAVAGAQAEDEIGRLLQTVLGRLFAEDFTATPETWTAAKTIDGYPRLDPLRAAWARGSGRLGRALRAVSEPLGEDPHAVHAVSIAVHNIHRSLLAMRDALAYPVERARLDEERVALRCLRAPAASLRVLTDPTQLPFRQTPAPVGTLLVFRLRKAAEARLDDATAFAAGEWSACPAQGYVRHLLRAVWRRAREATT
jgi:hypothetical protein